ncbi:hypothetical protein RhiJN_25678 [Ceratobasidium sp. AG-Ba]|nr:hypothetical protein RhiJN_25678 [Ceratobasidium sp. AG-Ba]
MTAPNSFANMFKRPYIGEAANILYDYLTILNKDFSEQTGIYYSKQVFILQSSGTGKSRTLIELKDRGAAVLYMNLQPEAKQDNTYPQRDLIPAQILTEDLWCSEQDYYRRCYAFFTALFQVLRSHLLEFRKAGSKPAEIIIAWSHFMCDTESDFRQQFFIDLYTRYLEAIQFKSTNGTNAISEPPAKKHRVENPASFSEELISRRMTLSSSSESATDVPASNSERLRLRGETQMKVAYNQLVDDVPEIFNIHSNEPSLIMEFDHVQSLQKPQETFLPAHLFSRVISEISAARPEVSTWCIISSTTPKVANFSDQVKSTLPVSTRAQLSFIPFCALTLDAWAPHLNDIDPARVAEFMHIVKFGRPLWSSLAESNMTPDQILTTAGRKLCNDMPFDPKCFHHVLATLGQRFLLTIGSETHDSVENHSVAVDNHLRLYLSAGEDHKAPKTGYCSEPLLSCAVTKLVYPLDTLGHSGLFSITETALETLKVAIWNYKVELGLKGELVSRLLFLLGKDAAIREHILKREMTSQAVAPGELLDCKYLPVDVYLDITLGIKLSAQDQNSFNGWHVNFSHWATVDEIPFGRGANPEVEMQTWLLCSWVRTCAMQCLQPQFGFNKIIPMYKFEDPPALSSNLGPSPQRVSCILISDRAVKAPTSPSDIDEIVPSPTGLPGLKQPHIVILADLGLDTEGVSYKIQSPDDFLKLRIRACGLGPVTYPFLTMTMAGYLRQMIADDPEFLWMRRCTNQATYGSTTKESSWKWWKR